MGFLTKLFGSKKEPKIMKRNLMNIQMGDIISYFGIDYEVYAVVEWMEEGFSWKEYKLKNREDSYWISAEIDDGELNAGFYTVIKDINLSGKMPEFIEYQGSKYELEEDGEAVGMMTSAAGKQSYKAKYWEYLCEGITKPFLAVEDYQGEIEISIGESLKESQVDILPGG